MGRGKRSASSSARPFYTLALCLLPIAFCLFVGCGRKDLPKPPEFVVPETIQSLSAEQTAAGVVLLWRRPQKYADGSRMDDLGKFQIERGADGAPFAPIAHLEVSDRDRFRKIRRFRYVDALAVPGHQYQYRVISLTIDAYVSAPSNVAEVTTVPLARPQVDR